MALLPMPFFLVASQRSGTTLLRLMLDQHPEIAFQHEFELAIEQVTDSGEWPPIDDYHAWLETNRDFHHSGYTIDPSLDYPHLVDSFLRQKQAVSGDKPIVGATVHLHFDRLIHLWPNARFIHLLRDGRDVTRSVLAKQWAGNSYHAAGWWLDAEGCWTTLASHLDEDQKIEVRYEDLVVEPERELRRLCAFIGVQFHEAMLEYTRNAVQYPRPDPKLACQWKSKLPEREVRSIESRIGSMLAERGYELSGLPHLDIGPFKHRLLLFQSRLIRLPYRMDRYGVMLVLSDLLSQRLRIAAWQRRVALQINTLDEMYLKEEAEGRRAPSDSIRPVS
jgi:hypothetical protein